MVGYKELTGCFDRLKKRFSYKGGVWEADRVDRICDPRVNPGKEVLICLSCRLTLVTSFV